MTYLEHVCDFLLCQTLNSSVDQALGSCCYYGDHSHSPTRLPIPITISTPYNIYGLDIAPRRSTPSIFTEEEIQAMEPDPTAQQSVRRRNTFCNAFRNPITLVLRFLTADRVYFLYFKCYIESKIRADSHFVGNANKLCKLKARR